LPEVFTVIDIETTGLSAATDHITEIAAIRFVIDPNGSVRELGRFQTYVALPVGAEIPPFITELTGISADTLMGASNETEASLSLEFFIGDSTVIAHNAPFDLSFLSTLHSDRFVCTRALSRLVEPSESARLADVCARHGIELADHHRAMNDAEATVKVFAKLRTAAEANGITYRNVVIDSEERPLTYVPRNAIVRKITKEAI